MVFTISQSFTFLGGIKNKITNFSVCKTQEELHRGEAMKRRLKVETAKQVKVGSGADGLMPPISPPVLPSTGGTTSSWSRNRHRLYVAPPPPQHACFDPARWPAGDCNGGGGGRSGRWAPGWGDGGWFLGEDGTPCPSLPCPDHCLMLPGPH